MWRVCAIVFAAYNYGYPGLAKIRPAVIDQPIASFHDEMNAAVVQLAGKAAWAGNEFIVFAGKSAERAKQEFGVATAKAEKI
jgi:hypothetical protein